MKVERCTGTRTRTTGCKESTNQSLCQPQRWGVVFDWSPAKWSCHVLRPRGACTVQRNAGSRCLWQPTRLLEAESERFPCSVTSCSSCILHFCKLGAVRAWLFGCRSHYNWQQVPSVCRQSWVDWTNSLGVACWPAVTGTCLSSHWLHCILDWLMCDCEKTALFSCVALDLNYVLIVVRVLLIVVFVCTLLCHNSSSLCPKFCS